MKHKEGSFFYRTAESKTKEYHQFGTHASKDAAVEKVRVHNAKDYGEFNNGLHIKELFRYEGGRMVLVTVTF